MITICWNCRGRIGAASTVKELKDINLKFMPQIVFLSETKAKSSKLQNLKRRLNFDNVFVVDCIGKSGGLCIFWKKSVKVEVLYSSNNVIHSFITNSNTNCSFHFSFMYGNPISQMRKRFWDTLNNLHQQNHKPWICTGDFNEILHAYDKNGGINHSRNLIQDFQDFLSHKDMEELPQRGCRYTWCNNRSIGTVQKKLDRCIANWELKKLFPHAIVTALAPISSDHSPIIIDDSPTAQQSKKVFKFEPYWTEHKDFESIIQQSWKHNGDDIIGNLSTVKANLETWNNQTFKRADYKIKKLKISLEKLYKQPPTKENMEKRFKIKKEVKELWKQEEMYWGTRAKVNWLRWGDRNSKYFHATTMRRRETNTIHRVKDITGEWRNDNDEIKLAFKEYFEDLFKEYHNDDDHVALHSIPTLISHNDNEMLLKDINEKEVKSVVFSLGANKAPGPDRLSGLFFHKAWNTIGQEVTKLVRDFFKNGILPEKINETHITLVPKIPNPEEIGHFRPISCCNFLMKIITRIMALRMKPLMSKIIATNQSAFVEGRQIEDNLLVVHEAFHSLKKKSKKADNYMAIKLDMSKAFDRVQWPFLRKIILKFGFNPSWVELILTSVNTVSYKVKINGCLGEEIFPRGGI